MAGKQQPDVYNLFETLLWSPQTGFRNLDRHLARLTGSAAVLSFTFNKSNAINALKNAVDGDSPKRVRLELSPDGKVVVSAQLYSATLPNIIWNVAFAKTVAASNDPLLKHKTTKREKFETARMEYPTETIQEVILLNEFNQICEGTFTNIFVDLGDERLATPDVSCGLLPGILRAQLLDQNNAYQTVLTMHDIINARAIFIGNSLRGLIEARVSEMTPTANWVGNL